MTRRRRRLLLWIGPRGGLFTGLALAGLVAVALTVTTDRGNAGGIDGLRAVIPGPSAQPGRVGSPPVFTAGPGRPAPTATPGLAVAEVSTGATGLTPPTAISAVPRPSTTPAPSATPITPNTPNVPGPSVPPTASPAPTPAGTPVPTPPPGPTAPADPVALVTDRGATALISLGGLVPGDRVTRTMAVWNTGTSAFRYTVSVTQTAATLLWTDPIDGLQLTLRTPAGVVLYSGSLAGLGVVAAPNVVPSGGSDALVYEFSLPASASNAFQGLLQDLTIVLTAVQYP